MSTVEFPRSPIVGLPTERPLLPAEKALMKKRAEYEGAQRALLRDPIFLRDFRDEWVQGILVGELKAHELRGETEKAYMAGFPEILPQPDEYAGLNLNLPFICDPFITTGLVDTIKGVTELITVSDITNVVDVGDLRYSGYSQDGSRYMGKSTRSAGDRFTLGLEVGTPMVEISQLNLRYPNLWTPLPGHSGRGYFAAGSRCRGLVPGQRVWVGEANVVAFGPGNTTSFWGVLSRGSALNFGS